ARGPGLRPASKAAWSHFTPSPPAGTTTTFVNPGFCRTELLTELATNYAEASVEAYAERRAKQIEFWKAQNGLQSGDPAKLARALITIASQEPPAAPLHCRRRCRWPRGAQDRRPAGPDRR